jgi:hypothetical protein
MGTGTFLQSVIDQVAETVATDGGLTCDKLVCSRWAVNLAEGCPEVGGQRVGGGDGMPSGLDLEGAVAAGGLDELADGPAGLVLDPAADRQGREDDGQVGLDRVAEVVVDGPGLQVAFAIRKDFSISKSRRYEPITNSAVTGVPSGQAARLVT